MIDAYTIGITLALNDGVTAGIASIRRELSALDLAIGQSAAGLNLLSILGRQISAPELTGLHAKTLENPRLTEPASVRSAEPAEPPFPKQERTVPLTTAPQQVDVPRTIPEPATFDRVAEDHEREASKWAAGSISPIIVEAHDFPVMAPRATTDNDTGRGQDGSVRATAEQAETGFAAFGAAVVPVPVLATGAGPAEAHIEEPARPHTALAGPTRSELAPPFKLADRQFATAPADMRPSVARSAEPKQEATPADIAGLAEFEPAIPDIRRPTAPATAPEPRPSGRHANEPGTSAPSIGTRETPFVGGVGGLSDSGGLYLDGARIGRWMFDRLAERASRPQAGVTGLDPRLTPSFPGAPFDS